jgi:chemotaxis protein CheY-P-specific phosphatase CheC
MDLSTQNRELFTSLIEKGVSRSAEALGRMSRTEWGIMSASTNEIPAVRLLSWFDRDKSTHYAARFDSKNDVPLEVVMLFTEKGAGAVTEAVTKPFSERLREMDDLVSLTIGEVSNIVAHNVIGAFADKIGRTVILSVPEVHVGPKAQVLGRSLEGYDGREDVIMLSHVELYSENLAAECSMVLIVNEEELAKLFVDSGAV